MTIITLILFLIVVALGWGALQGCCVGEGERVEVAPLVTPVSRIPIANEVTLIPRYVYVSVMCVYALKEMDITLNKEAM